MWGHHLKRRGRWWHYFRAVPERYANVEARREICFSLRTQDFAEAKLKAAQISVDLDVEWQRAVELGVSLKSQSAATRYAAAAQAQVSRGFKPAIADELSDDDVMGRLRLLINGTTSSAEQKAVLGLVEKPTLSMMDAFDRFWDHIEDEWSALSHDQRRVKRNGYLKALSNFREAVGDVPMYELERVHAMAFRTWWLKRIKAKGLKPHTGNKDINALRRMITTNYDIDALQQTNPLARVRLKDEVQTPRLPMTKDQINAAVVPGALGKIAPEFVVLFKLLINTGMRPVVEILNIERPKPSVTTGGDLNDIYRKGVGTKTVRDPETGDLREERVYLQPGEDVEIREGQYVGLSETNEPMMRIVGEHSYTSDLPENPTDADMTKYGVTIQWIARLHDVNMAEIFFPHSLMERGGGHIELNMLDDFQRAQRLSQAFFGAMAGYNGELLDQSDLDRIPYLMQFQNEKGDAVIGDVNPEQMKADYRRQGVLEKDGGLNWARFTAMIEANRNGLWVSEENSGQNARTAG